MLRKLTPFLFLAAGCGGSPATGPGPTDAGPGTLFLWIGADRDTFTSCPLAQGCPDGGPNNALAGEIQVANEDQVEQKRGYVHFALPTLPPDAVIEVAYLELYHPAIMGDGRSDDLCVPVSRVTQPWDPFTIDWQNQPVQSPGGGELVLALRSDAWVRADVTAVVRDHYADPATNHGFAISFGANVQADKAFYSNNAVSRTADDLGRGPRLLLEVTSAKGGEIGFPEVLDAATDLRFPGESALMGLAVVSDDWPEDWAVAIDDGRCL